MLASKFQHKNIILASGSPRRQELFKGLDIPFSIQVREIDETYDSKLKAEEITDFLAEEKANAFTDLKQNDILITSDTIVWHDHKPLEKPKDAQHAQKMLMSMSDKCHEVITSVCISSISKRIVFHSKTKVYVKRLGLDEIDYYVNNYNPYDKAGSYGIQEWFGFIAVSHIEGSYFNVMGLPVHKLYEELQKM